LEGRIRIIDTYHPNFKAVREILKSKDVNDEEKLRTLVDIPTFIAAQTHGRVQVSAQGNVMFDGKPMKGVVVDRIMALLKEGFDIAPLARFLDKLQGNPIPTARDELYLWIEQSSLTLTPTGNFLAFKRVRDDYTSVHGGVVSNKVGEQPSMPREEVDPDRSKLCSTGLHFCGYSYLDYFSGDRLMIVEVNPADVVAIPSDYNNAKGRAWTYKVVGEITEEETHEKITGRSYIDEYEYEYEDDAVDVYDDENYEDYDPLASALDDGVIDDNPEMDRVYDTPKSFINKRTGKRIVVSAMLKRVKQNGQRATAIHYDIPRTTLQNWIKKTSS